jgi:hypothetical protein
VPFFTESQTVELMVKAAVLPEMTALILVGVSRFISIKIYEVVPASKLTGVPDELTRCTVNDRSHPSVIGINFSNGGGQIYELAATHPIPSQRPQI